VKRLQGSFRADLRERVRCSSLVDWPVDPRRSDYAGLFALTQSGVCHTYVILRLVASDRHDRE
jgi:hypothetical protein